jgi:hypothetical protein
MTDWTGVMKTADQITTYRSGIGGCMVGAVYFGRILRLYLVCLGMLFSQTLNAALPSSGPAYGLLWEISSPGSSPSYLFGTIHSGDAGVIGLAPAVERAFTGSRQVILEVNLDADAMVGDRR